VRKPSNVGNPDIIPFAIYRLGGIGEFVDVEDIFVRCYELAPERFGWRKYPYPNYKILSKALRDFEGRFPNYLIKTQDRLRRQLSAEGLEWLKTRLPELERVLHAPGTSPPVRRPIQRMLNDLAENPIVQKFLAGEPLDIQKHEIADMLLCSPDSPPSVFKERLEIYRVAAKNGSRKELTRFLEYLRTKHKQLFGG
jgi:hypothetical protein